MSQLAREYLSIFRHQTICEFTFPFIKKRLTTINSKFKFCLLSQKTTFNSRFISSKNNILNPNFITGFIDAEGSFLINIQPRSSLGFSISLSFKIKLHPKDKELLERILYFFNVGKIYTRKGGYIEYIVNSMKDLEIIINQLNDYPLITQKLSDYKLFKLVFVSIKQKKHLTNKGFQVILSLKASFNNGISEELKLVFPNIVPCLRPKTVTPKLGSINPY